MKKHIYRITIKEPLVLVEKEKTEQSTKTLEYIPGNIFRGIVAGAVIKNNEEQIIDDILFNGEVKFGDAHLVINDKRSYKVPLTYYHDKSNDDDITIYNYSKLNLPEDFAGMKPKQIKNRYFVEGKGEEINIQKVSTGDSIKSARSKKHRSSKEGYMYVYRYLKKGQTFEFEILSANDDLLNKVKTYLTNGTKFLGKAKGSEYGGKVLVDYIKEKTVNQSKEKGNIIYAESNLCFLNEYGEFTARPTGEQLTGNPDAKIDWKKSQVRFRTFMPYNRHRQNWDAERLIIEKGSVFVLKNKKEQEEPININNFEVGCFLTEGYGRILINPDFLKEDKYSKVKNNSEETNNVVTTNDNNNPFLQILKTKKEDQDLLIEIQKKIDKFGGKNKFSKSITSSQWSRAYNLAKRANSKDDLETLVKNELFDNDKIWKNPDKKLINDFIANQDDEQAVYAFKLLCKRMRELTKYDKN